MDSRTWTHVLEVQTLLAGDGAESAGWASGDQGRRWAGFVARRQRPIILTRSCDLGTDTRVNF